MLKGTATKPDAGDQKESRGDDAEHTAQTIVLALAGQRGFGFHLIHLFQVGNSTPTARSKRAACMPRSPSAMAAITRAFNRKR